MDLKLCSPFGADPIVYHWPTNLEQTRDNKEGSGAIVETMRWAVADFPALKLPLENNILTDFDCNSFESMKSLCDKFNRVISNIVTLYKGTSFWQRLSRTPSKALLKHIIHQVYYQSVPEPEKLNQYEPFSPEVYGETSFEFISQMIDEISIKKEDVFIDLGSGVGQVVLQMAAATSCKISIGIEKAEVPCAYAEKMSENFKKWMNWYGKDYGEYRLIRGNFLDEDHREIINSASIVFVNNFAFGPQVDHSLKQCFADLRDGARIISSKAFCPLNFRTTDRNLSDIGTIMHVTEMQPLNESVSWTGKPVSYYLHVIDRTKLERYFQKIKDPTRNIANGGSEGTWTDDEPRNGHTESQKTSDGAFSSEESDVPLARRLISNRNPLQNTDDDSQSTNSSISKRILRKRTARKAPPKSQQPPLKVRRSRSRGKKTGKMRKTLASRINGLDILHNETVRSTAVKQLLPDYVDIPLSELSDEDSELTLPESTYRSLEKYLSTIKKQFISSLLAMKKRRYSTFIKSEIEKERHRNADLIREKNKLEDHIKELLKEGVGKLGTRLREIGFDLDLTMENFHSWSSELCVTNAELRALIEPLNNEISILQSTHEQLLTERQAEALSLDGDSKCRTKEKLMEDIIETLNERRKLKSKLKNLQPTACPPSFTH